MHDDGPTEGVYEPRALGWVAEPERIRSRRRHPQDMDSRVDAERQKHEKRRDEFLASAKGGAFTCAALLIVFFIWPGFWTFVLASGMVALEVYTLNQGWVEHRSAGFWKS